MRRPLHITELAAQPFPLGLIGSLMQEHAAFLQDICFQDNEIGDRAQASDMYMKRVVRPVNVRLQRNGKALRLVSIDVDHSRHHTVKVEFQTRSGDDWQKDCVRMNLFMVSKKSIAMERKAEEDGEEFTIVAPRRGATPPKKTKKSRRKAAAVSAA